MSRQVDHYATLGVSPTSDDVVIRAAFKAMMLKYHPDTNKSADSTKRAAEINAAFAILGNPAKRAEYDALRSDSSRTSSASRAQPPPPPPPPPPQNTPPPSPSPWEGMWGWARTNKQGISVAAALVALAATSVVLSGQKGRASSEAESLPQSTAYARPWSGPDTTQGLPNLYPDSSSDSLNSALGDVVEPQPMTSLSYNDIEAAVTEFDRTLKRRGIIGAVAYSKDCHAKALKLLTWSAADRCAAFDYAASYIDRGMVEAAGIRPEPYFAFMLENQSDTYSALGAYKPIVTERLDKLRRSAERQFAVRVIDRSEPNDESMQAQATPESKQDKLDQDWIDRVTRQNPPSPKPTEGIVE